MSEQYRWLKVQVIEDTQAGTAVCALFDDGAAAGWFLVHPEAIRDCNVILEDNELVRKEAAGLRREVRMLRAERDVAEKQRDDTKQHAADLECELERVKAMRNGLAGVCNDWAAMLNRVMTATGTNNFEEAVYAVEEAIRGRNAR